MTFAGFFTLVIFLLIAKVTSLSLWSRVWSVEHNQHVQSGKSSMLADFGNRVRTLRKEYKQKERAKSVAEHPSGEQLDRFHFVRNAAKLVGPSVVRIDGQRDVT